MQNKHAHNGVLPPGKFITLILKRIQQSVRMINDFILKTFAKKAVLKDSIFQDTGNPLDNANEPTGIVSDMQLLLDSIAQISGKNSITPYYKKIATYLQKISSKEFYDDEKRTRKAKFFHNKQIYE